MIMRSLCLSLVMLSSMYANVVHVNTLPEFEKEVLNSELPVYVDFFATWCGPCKSISKHVESIGKERKDIKVVKVDVDKVKEVAEKHKVRSMPTHVIFHKGKEKGRFVGAHSKEGLNSKIDEIIKDSKAPAKPAKKEAAKAEVPKPAPVKEAENIEMPEPSKEEALVQELMSALMMGDVESAKKTLNKDNINFMIETPQMDLTPLSLIILSDNEEMLNHALTLKPDLSKEINMNGKKQSMPKHLKDMAEEARKQADKFEKLAKKLS